MKNLLKKYITLVISIIIIFILTTTSSAYFIKNFSLNRQSLNLNDIPGICKIYSENEVYYYGKDSKGEYTNSIDVAEVETRRNNIKQILNSLNRGEYLVAKILDNDSYYNKTNKEFCFKRSTTSVSTDRLTKVIVIGYDDNYQFKSNLTSGKGAYKVKKINDTEEFNVSYDDTWVEAELSIMYDAKSIALDKTNIELKVGETEEIRYSVLPENVLNKSVTVSYSSGITIDTETFGVVKITANKVGNAHITVKLRNNEEISATCNIKVISNSTNPSPSPSPTPNPPAQEEKITSNKYLVDSSKKYIYNITPKIKISDFKSNIQSNVNYKIYGKNGYIVANEDTAIATYMKLKTEKQEYTIIVKGDIDGNGRISITDLVKIKLFSIHIKIPNEIEKIASDINGDRKISITDVVRLKLASVNIKQID